MGRFATDSPPAQEGGDLASVLLAGIFGPTRQAGETQVGRSRSILYEGGTGMRYFRIAIAAAAVCLLVGLPAQAARKDSGVVDASKRLAGFTAGELLGEELRQVLELPLDVNPAAGADNCLFAGHQEKVLLLWTRREPDPLPVCDVKPGTPLFFYALGGECSSVEEEPFFGATEEAQRQCMLDFLASTPFDAIEVRVDGGPPVNIGRDRYLAVSEQGTVDLPDPNVLAVPGGQATFVAAGYVALVRPLPPGSHTITVTIVGGPFRGTNRAVVNVVPGLRS